MHQWCQHLAVKKQWTIRLEVMLFLTFSPGEALSFTANAATLPMTKRGPMTKRRQNPHVAMHSLAFAFEPESR
jgi:hypothetical protein